MVGERCRGSNSRLSGGTKFRRQESCFNFVADPLCAGKRYMQAPTLPLPQGDSCAQLGKWAPCLYVQNVAYEWICNAEVSRVSPQEELQGGQNVTGMRRKQEMRGQFTESTLNAGQITLVDLGE